MPCSCRKTVFLFLALLILWPIAALSVPAEGQRIMIAGPSPHAVDIGKKIARKGGNAVDVAVASVLSLAVTHPYYAALGGGGFALVKVGRTVEALDFREVAPLASKSSMYLTAAKNASQDGGLAVAVPGLPAGLWALHKKYGKLHWSRLFPELIELATKGFEVSGEWVALTAETKARFNSGGKKFFLRPDGTTYKPGDVLKQPELAKLLKEMSNRGPVPFYSGLAAHDIVDSVRAAGGIMSVDDLENYKVRWLKPLISEFRGHRLYLMPPPSSGGVILASALKLAEISGLTQKLPLSIDELHLMAEIMKMSFQGRPLLGDPDFNTIPVSTLISDKYLEDLAKRIKHDKAATVDATRAAGPSTTQTTHLSVMDANGEAVAMTVTLNGAYGSGVVTSRYGIALNNEMDDFTTAPGQPNMFGLIQGPANEIAPNKRPLSSMSPTLVEKDGKIVMSLGAPGGPRIITGVFQVLYRSLVQGWDIDRAVQTSRVHHQYLPNIVYVDRARLAPESIEGLRKRGHVIEESWTAKVYGVVLGPEKILYGAFDSRGEGAAGGF